MVGYRVETAVRAEQIKHTRIVVARCSDVYLHAPAAARIFLCKKAYKLGLVFVDFVRCQPFAGSGLFEHPVKLGCVGALIRHAGKGVVARAAAHSLEQIYSVKKHLGELLIAADFLSRRLFKSLQPVAVAGQLDAERLIGSKRRNNAAFEAPVLGEQLMILEAVRRIVRGAEADYVRAFDKLARGESARRYFRVRAVPDVLRRLFAQRLIYVKISLKLKVSPMIERIAEKIGHYLRPRHKFFVRGRVARDVLFRDAAGAHGAPLVVIARKPEPRYVLGRAVFVYFLGRQVAMPIKNRHGARCGEELARGVALKQKILVHKSFHLYLLPICCRYYYNLLCGDKQEPVLTKQ